MEKQIKKRDYHKLIYNPNVVERLREKYGVSKRYITASLRGDRTSETSDKIKKDYQIMDFELKKTLNNL